ncbi:uncharacterized protein LOC130629268 [Hydractinia symbiolongicarpus]|uniref:uncharacterized protein LOC130629268 n=1 Tax=Hydractinia symbiolongicarpus TaxID=13093 RepID=UPI002550AE10|nr:uncharacterized protein LOC130629268 [Hydractinia symbiolongicarpus]
MFFIYVCQSLKKAHTCRKLYPLRDKRVYEVLFFEQHIVQTNTVDCFLKKTYYFEERDTINLHGESDKGSSHNDDDYKQTKKRQVRKRKKLFDEDELKVLRKKCKRMICEYETMTKCQIKDVLAGTNLIKKYD